MNHYWPGAHQDSPPHRPVPVHRHRRVQLLLTLVGFLRVRVCGLCGSLVVADAAHQHERVHSVELGTARDRQR